MCTHVLRCLWDQSQLGEHNSRSQADEKSWEVTRWPHMHRLQYYGVVYTADFCTKSLTTAIATTLGRCPSQCEPGLGPTRP
jgi:hypothetical protein